MWFELVFHLYDQSAQDVEGAHVHLCKKKAVGGSGGSVIYV